MRNGGGMKNALPNKITFVRGDLIEDDIGMILFVAENGITKKGEYVIMHEKDYNCMIGGLQKIEKLLATFRPTDA